MKASTLKIAANHHRNHVFLPLVEIISGSAESRPTKNFQKCFQLLTVYCMGLLNDRISAENIASETISKLVEHYDVRSILNIDAWVYTVARNLSLSKISKKKRHKEKKGDLKKTIAFRNSRCEENFIARDLEEIISSHLIPFDQKIWNLYLFGYNNQEIGEILDLQAKTIANRKSQIREKLKKSLLQEDIH